jgi:8-oxo-dGTP pyrophosphatase MutT (NUDIX family)
MIWKPNVTVAAVIRRDGRYLLVEEDTEDGRRFNQPAGHLEAGETIVEAAVREVREETAYEFRPTALIGIYLWPHPAREVTYLRFAFTGELTGFDPARRLDDGIVRTHWLTVEEIGARASLHRSPLVMQCIADHENGQRCPLETIRCYGVT